MHNGTVIAVALTLLLLGAPARAQEGTGTLAGCVSDGVREPLPGATIRVSGPNIERTIVTEPDGCFRASDLPPATYFIVATLTGFSAVTRDELKVQAGALTRVDFRMGVPPTDLCECLTLPRPTVLSLWQKADAVAQVRIARHDYGPEDAIARTVTHTATVLRLWKDTGRGGEVRNSLRFVQPPYERPAEPYVVGQDFILFLTANSQNPFNIAGAFALENGRVHSAPVAGYPGTTADDLVAEIAALVGK
jgi:carboxypeptidase family protein